jgi:hypothetical protein
MRPVDVTVIVHGPTFAWIRPSKEPMTVNLLLRHPASAARPLPSAAVAATARHAVLRPFLALLALLVFLMPPAAVAGSPQPGPPVTIRKSTGPITIDGDLSDPGWQGIDSVSTWFETKVGDNVEPHVKNVGYLAYDDKYLYAAFRFDDPDPKLIRAPLGDHDALSGTSDYGGIIVDSRNDGKTAQMFLANANGLEYDAISSDVTGEDNSPDWYWDTAGKITDTGYTLEIRVPFSSLRYANTPAPTWGILLYRNYPRERHYQFFSSKLPRDVNCMVCNSSKMTGLADLPQGSHLVVAPFATTQRTAGLPSGPNGQPQPLGGPLVSSPFKSVTGLDVKWSPFTGLAIDGTVKPDFSQVEADAGQIVANERFALFVPEKRNFFLEGADLFATPLQAVYTRTVNAPEFGVRATGRVGQTAFTSLFARDRGEGVVIIPGSEGNDFALQDFRSDAGVIRVRHDYGPSFVSALATVREIEGGGHNRLVGPDFQWRPRPTDTFTGQALWSHSTTPQRTDLSPEWDGRTLSDRALVLNWQHGTPKLDWYVQAQDLGLEFRADDGFIPQVGYREYYGQLGYTMRPEKRFFSRVRLFAESFLDEEQDGTPLNRHVQVGAGADGRFASFTRIELNRDEFRVGGRLLQRFRPRLSIEASPTRALNNLSFSVASGDEIDFDNARRGSGTNISLSGTFRPDVHTALSLTTALRWLDVDAGAAGSGRLFTAQLERLRGTYMFNSRMFVRVIAQHVQTRRDPALYTRTMESKSADLSLSGLFAYKINFQTVLYAGYGDQSTYSSSTAQLEKSGRQAFAKVSYAWQM